VSAALPAAIRPWATGLATLTAVLAAIGYLVAFIPPAPVREVWQGLTAHRGIRDLLAVAGESPSEIWQRFLVMARQASGAEAAALVVGGPGNHRVTAVEGRGVELIGSGLSQFPGEPDDGEIAGGELLDRLCQATGARLGNVVPLGDEPEAPRLLLLTRHRALFAEDERALLRALGRQAASLVERRQVLVEQEALGRTLSETVEALRNASQAKSDFLASMSHELRTPLNAILGFSDLIRSEPANQGDVTVPLEWAEHIHRGGQHLLGLVNDVLDLSKIEAGRLDLDIEPMELGAAVAESVSGLRPLADRKAIALDVQVPANTDVLADRGRVRQILYNLLSNAIKYTPSGGRVTVAAERLDGSVHLSVTDTGVGISTDDQALVFEEFRQVGDPAKRQEGTGLGLALTRRLVEAHGGRLELTSELGVGSRFTAVLPGVVADEAARAAEASTTPIRISEPPATPSILLVEDDASAVRLIRAYLEPERYDVRIASSGEDAIEAARAVRPSAILLDILLPGIDGWEVLRRIKDDEELRDIPVVILTVVDERDVGFALGAVDYLVKPVDRTALLGSLERHVDRAALGSRAARVLAVDDDPATLAMIERALAPAGYDVVAASGGVEALDMAARSVPDLVICDLVMPEVDGFGVVAGLKANPLTSSVPILILTAHDLSAADKARLRGNVLGIVSKGTDARLQLRDWLSRVAVVPGQAGG
jgi:signal transduction histidine kinase/DNA-binding response OmpR family regulator